MKLRTFLTGAVLAGINVWHVAAAKLGDAAGPLVIKEWIKGRPVDVTDGKQVYVVEFWATWCGPCRRSIPHLTELQKKFKDKGVVFVGISDEPATTVKPFVEKMAEQMEYTVACDDERQSNAKYMAAYGQGGIPHAFVVGKDRKVAWHGHPMAGLEEVLEQILAGKYDVAARAALEQYDELSMRGDAKAKEFGRKLLADAGNEVQALVDLAFRIAGNVRNPHRDFDLATEALNKAEKLANGKDHRILGVRSIVLFETGQQQTGLSTAKQALALSTDDVDQARYKNFIRVMEMRMERKETKE